jgi:hypothetical protein
LVTVAPLFVVMVVSDVRTLKVITDGWASYPSACGDEYTHQPEPIATSGSHAHELLPARP